MEVEPADNRQVRRMADMMALEEVGKQWVEVDHRSK